MNLFFQNILTFVLEKLFNIPGISLKRVFLTKNLGKPSEVNIPRELIPIGAELLSQGYFLNQFVSTHPQWIFPYWMENQLKPRSPGFIPQGHSPFLLNSAYRNWTAIGNLDSPHEGIVDPRGMFTPFRNSWSLHWVINENGVCFHPSIADKCLQFLDKNVPAILTHFEVFQSLNVTDRSSAFREDDHEWYTKSVELQNKSEESIHIKFGWALRPFNPEGIGFIHHIIVEHEFWTINEKEKLLFRPLIQEHDLSDYSKGDVIIHGPSSSGTISCDVGLATAVGWIDLNISPGEKVTVEAFIPIDNVASVTSLPDEKTISLHKSVNSTLDR
jgi:hypothetical protein